MQPFRLGNKGFGGCKGQGRHRTPTGRARRPGVDGACLGALQRWGGRGGKEEMKEVRKVVSPAFPAGLGAWDIAAASLAPSTC